MTLIRANRIHWILWLTASVFVTAAVVHVQRVGFHFESSGGFGRHQEFLVGWPLVVDGYIAQPSSLDVRYELQVDNGWEQATSRKVNSLATVALIASTFLVLLTCWTTHTRDWRPEVHYLSVAVSLVIAASGIRFSVGEQWMPWWVYLGLRLGIGCLVYSIISWALELIYELFALGTRPLIELLLQATRMSHFEARESGAKKCQSKVSGASNRNPWPLL